MNSTETIAGVNGLTNKVALVIGGSRGIGAAVVRRLAQSGCSVAIGYCVHREDADLVASEIGAMGTRATTVQGDIAAPEGARKIVGEALKVFPKIDIVVNSAGIAPYRPLEAIDAAFVRRIFDVNVLGVIQATQAVVSHLSSPGGRIINFASGLAFRPIPNSSVYAASKAAVVSLTHAFSKELGPRGITVNAVAPGVIATDMTAGILKERGAEILSATPLGRIGQPEDIAGIVAFLASPEAGWITGRTILADGGVL